MTPIARTVELDIRLHPGLPDPGLLEPVVRRILEGTDLRANRLDDKRLVPRSPADAAAFIVEAWHETDGIHFGVEGGGGSFVIGAKAYPGAVQGSLVVLVDDAADIDGLAGLAAEVAQILPFPLSTVSRRGPSLLERAGWGARSARHRIADRAVHGNRQYGLHCGLPGVAPRMVLGTEVVAQLGEHRLEAAPGELVGRVEGSWVLRGAETVDAWDPEVRCPSEVALVELLGPEHFFDPADETLPQTAPDLPEVAPYRCRTRTPGTDVWTQHEGDLPT